MERKLSTRRWKHRGKHRRGKKVQARRGKKRERDWFSDYWRKERDAFERNREAVLSGETFRSQRPSAYRLRGRRG
jgi:hypothetical protein